MGVFTFVCKSAGGEWKGKQYEGELEAAANSTYDLQRKLVSSALSVDSSGGVSSSFSLISPTSAVFQVIVGGGGGGGGGAFIGGGAAAAAAPAGGAAPAVEASAAEAKKEEKEEESDDDMGFGLFD